MKKRQFIGGVLLLIFLIIFDIGIYTRILGIQGPSIITVATGFLDAVDEWKESQAAKTQNDSKPGSAHEGKADANATGKAGNTNGNPAGANAIGDTGTSSASTNAARDTDGNPVGANTTGDAGTSSASANAADTGSVSAGTNNKESDSGEKNSETADASGTDGKTGDETATGENSGLNAESSLAEIMGYPSYSILNGPEGRFLTQIAGYDDNDYSYTMVTACIPPDGSIADKPAPVSLAVPSDEPGRTYEVQVYSSLESKIVYVGRGIPSGGNAEIYNLIPGDICGYQIFAEEYEDPASGQIFSSRLITSECFQVNPYEMRGILTESLNNVRDLGGWPTKDGRHVKYGLLYRGSAFDSGGERLISDSDVSLLKDRLGIRNELDLRWDSEIMLEGESTLGGDINYRRVPMQLYVTFVSDEENGDQLKTIFDMITLDEPLYFHCAIGCDRTGTLSFLLLGLLGVSESNINKEYELSSFSIYGPRTRDNGETFYKEMIFFIKENFPGDTLADKIQNYLLQRGVGMDKIERFRDKMLE